MENVSTEYLKELSTNQGFNSELLDNAGHLPHTDGAGDSSDISDIVDDISKDTEEDDSINNDTSERFVSVLERRRMMRKSEEEKEIDWKVSGKVDEEEMKSMVENRLSKLKDRFSKEKEARKSIVKPNRSYYNFCNSVDAFLRHIEKPKIDIKYSEVNDDSQGEELYSFGVRPASIGNNRKVRSFDTPVNDSGINTLTTKEDDDEVIKKDMDGVASGKENTVGKEVIESHIGHIVDDTLFDQASQFPATLDDSSSSPDDKICPAIFTGIALLHLEADDNILKQDIFDNILQRGSGDNIVLQGNDGCQFNPIANDMWTYENLNPLQCGKSSSCPRDIPIFFKEIYPQNKFPITQNSPAIDHTNASIVPFTETVPFTKRYSSICGIHMTVPLKYLKKIVNNYAYQFLINAKLISKEVYGFAADENLIEYTRPIRPIIYILAFKDIIGIISLAAGMCPITKHYTLDIWTKPSRKFITVVTLNSKQRHDFNICEKSTNQQPHGVFEHQVSKVPQIFNLSLEDERVTNVTTTADDQNVFADDSQRTGNIFEKSTNQQPHGVFEHQVSKVPQIFNLSLEDERVTNVTTTADDQNVFADDSQRTENIFEKSTNKQPHGVFEHQVSEMPKIFNLSLHNEPMTEITTADDQNVSADDSQRTGNEIIDEWDDVGSFGIMSIYCNSEIHSGYARVPADDPPESIRLK